ncbi:unnamed protein product [Periconia digitata]|uniref:DNA helicase Pif1-like 2B domain-containing protein n=1 Tax=Periconia digitata TaxID=1303443 RepID=A0A9W4UKJ1_9PLEO|nr:unnamed protein product [Periconia digitata]
MKEARGNRKAFGGVQMVVTGDFCQLPPVLPFEHCVTCGLETEENKWKGQHVCPKHGVFKDIDKWAFRSDAWQESGFTHVNLTTIHRQSHKAFIAILHKMRRGIVLNPGNHNLIVYHPSDTRDAIELYTRKERVKQRNDEMFDKLPTEPQEYQCLDSHDWKPDHFEWETMGHIMKGGALSGIHDDRYDAKVALKEGMLVVLLHNLDLPAGLVNGSQGTIQRFEKRAPHRMPVASKNSGGYGSQNGQLLLQGEYAVYRQDKIREFAKQENFPGWPVVKFMNGLERTIYADCTVTELSVGEPKIVISRTQIPLTAGWAITTHKSQGMTLDRVIVDLSGAFELGQAYVALSRARSLEGLKVISFPVSAQGCNAQVKKFMVEMFGPNW